MNGHVFTQSDAHAYLEQALSPYAEDFDIPAMAEEMKRIHGSWNFEIMDQGLFWAIARDHHTAE